MKQSSMFKRLLAYSKVAIPLLLGICIGVALSTAVLPFLAEQNCEWNVKDSTFSNTNSDMNTSKHHSHLTKGVDWNLFRQMEFDPRVITLKQSESQTAQKPVRHRFIRSEIDIKETLFVGYLVTNITSRGYALNKTIARPQEKDLALKFFFDTRRDGNSVKMSDSSSWLVSLNLMDPNTLVLLAIKYIYTNMHSYNQYQYYALLPDTVYVITPSLSSYLRQLDEEPFVGFPSASDRSVCDLSLGFIISQALVATVAVNINRCEQVFKVNRDPMQAMNKCLQLIEPTECVTRPRLNFQLMEHQFAEGEELSYETVTKNHIISGIQTTRDIYKIRRAIIHEELRKTYNAIKKLDGDVGKMVYSSAHSPAWPPAVNRPFKTTNRFDVPRWTLVSNNISHLEYDYVNRQVLEGEYSRIEMEMVQNSMANLNWNSTRYVLNKVEQSYRRFDPSRGVEYKISLNVHDHLLGVDETKLFELVRPTTEFELHPITQHDSKYVHIIVPVFPFSDVTSLLETFNDLLRKDSHFTLQLLLIYSKEEYKSYQVGDDIFMKIKATITDKETQIANGHMIKWKMIPGSKRPLLEAIAETVATLGAGSIVLTSTVNTRINSQFMDKVRVNVVETSHVYAPMAFWQHEPKLNAHNKSPSNNLDIARATGHFGDKWFDHLAFLARDLTQAITDSDYQYENLFKLLLHTIPDVSVLRAPDADCVVTYQEQTCSYENVIDRRICTAQKLDNVGSGPILAMNLLKDAASRGKSDLM